MTTEFTIEQIDHTPKLSKRQQEWRDMPSQRAWGVGLNPEKWAYNSTKLKKEGSI